MGERRGASFCFKPTPTDCDDSLGLYVAFKATRFALCSRSYNKDFFPLQTAGSYLKKKSLYICCFCFFSVMKSFQCVVMWKIEHFFYLIAVFCLLSCLRQSHVGEILGGFRFRVFIFIISFWLFLFFLSSSCFSIKQKHTFLFTSTLCVKFKSSQRPEETSVRVAQLTKSPLLLLNVLHHDFSLF